MKKGKIILIAMGYLGGIAVAMKFNKKGHAETKKAIEKSGSFFDTYFENFLSIHKDIFKYFEQKIVSDDNIKKVEDFKKMAIDEVESFKNEATKKLEELKDKGIKKKDEIENELKAIYDKRQEYFDKAKEIGQEYTDEAIVKGKEYINEGKKMLDKAFEEIKSKIK